MTPPANQTVQLAEIAADMKHVRQQIEFLTQRFEAAEKERITRSEAYQNQHAEMRQKLALHESRIEHVERSSCQNEDDLKRLEITVQQLSSTVKIISAALGAIAMAAGTWLISQILGLLP